MARQADFQCMAAFVDFAAVTTHDTNAQPAHDAIYVGVAGDITVIDHRGGSAITFKAVPVGIFPIRVKVIKSTGTTATNLTLLSY